MCAWETRKAFLRHTFAFKHQISESAGSQTHTEQLLPPAGEEQRLEQLTRLLDRHRAGAGIIHKLDG